MATQNLSRKLRTTQSSYNQSFNNTLNTSHIDKAGGEEYLLFKTPTNSHIRSVRLNVSTAFVAGAGALTVQVKVGGTNVGSAIDLKTVGVTDINLSTLSNTINSSEDVVSLVVAGTTAPTSGSLFYSFDIIRKDVFDGMSFVQPPE